MRMRHNLTIDPGLSGTGYAVWDEDWNLLSNGVVNGGNKKKGYQIISELSKKLKDYTFYIAKVFIELPAKFSGAKGEMVANQGGLVKLSMFAGSLEQKFLDMGYDVVMVPVIKWKGQLPKEVVIKRIKRLLPKAQATSHDWDAIGIGLYLKGDL